MSAKSLISLIGVLFLLSLGFVFASHQDPHIENSLGTKIVNSKGITVINSTNVTITNSTNITVIRSHRINVINSTNVTIINSSDINVSNAREWDITIHDKKGCALNETKKSCIDSVEGRNHTCIDSDGGRNYNMSGQINLTNKSDGKVSSFSDQCESDALLTEYFCMTLPIIPGVRSIDEVVPASERVVCPHGCKNGACLPCIHFIRGDANMDGVVDISDGKRILDWLFIDASAKISKDSADVNKDGEIDLSDSIYIFGFLFTGVHKDIPDPFPEPGCAP